MYKRSCGWIHFSVMKSKEVMNITSDNLIALSKQLEEKYASGTLVAQEIDRYHQSVEKNETEFISLKSSIFPLRNTELSSPTDMSKVGAMKAGEFYNYEAMKAIGEKVTGVLLSVSVDIQDSPDQPWTHARAIAHQVHMRERTEGMHRIGSESVYGYAMSGPIDGENGLYIVKTPRRIHGEVQDLTHEQYVGYRLNPLRSEVVGFALVLGGARAPEPEINDAGEILSFCSPVGAGPTNKVSYLVYENVFPSESMKDYINKASVSDFLSDFLQTCYTLETARELVGFTHYDLHSENILRRKVADVPHFSLKFHNYRTGGDVYIACTAAATMIDYGRSRVTASGSGASMSALEPWMVQGFMTKDANTLSDAYKLLMSLALALIGGGKVSPRNEPVYREMEKIFRFFNQKETIAQAIVRQADLYYAIPKVAAGVYDLVEHINTFCPVSEISGLVPQFSVLQCGVGGQFSVCHNFAGTLKKIQAEGVTLVTFFEFYDFATHALAKPEWRTRYDEVYAIYNYRQGSAKFIAKIDNLKTRVLKALSSISDAEHVNLNGAVAKDLANKALVASLSTSLDQIITGIAWVEDISLYLKVANVIGQLYEDSKIIEYIADGRAFISRAMNELNGHIEIMRSHYAVFRSLVIGGRWEIYAQRFPWYHTMLTQVVYLIHRMRATQAQMRNELPPLPVPMPAPSPVASPIFFQSVDTKLVPVSSSVIGSPKVTAVRDANGKIREVILL